jgi:hypothetical protein
MKCLKIMSWISIATSFITFCVPLVIQFISSARQGYWKARLGEELELGIDVLAKKRWWSDITDNWLATWTPIFWSIALVLFGVSVLCITLYFLQKRNLSRNGNEKT